jgi:DNA-binding NtrC family response regulator
MTRAARDEPDLRATSVRHGANAIRGKRILYVDDDPSVRWATNALLQDAGAICLLASTHDQAVALAGGEPRLALAILDFQMPDDDVDCLVKRLRAARAVLPLIGTSGADRSSEFAARGVTRFLEKPWQLGDLVRAVDTSNPRFWRVPPLDPWMSARFPRD